MYKIIQNIEVFNHLLAFFYILSFSIIGLTLEGTSLNLDSLKLLTSIYFLLAASSACFLLGETYTFGTVLIFSSC